MQEHLYETSSWAPTRTTYSYEPYPVGGAYQASGPPQPAFQLDYVVPPLHAQTYAPIQHEAYGNASQYPAQYPLYLPMQTSDHIPAPVTAEAATVGAQATSLPTRALRLITRRRLLTTQRPATSRNKRRIIIHICIHSSPSMVLIRIHSCHLYAPVPAPSQIDSHQQASSSRARTGIFRPNKIATASAKRTKQRRTVSQRRSKPGAKHSTDHLPSRHVRAVVYKALRGASKRSRTRTQVSIGKSLSPSVILSSDYL